MRGINKNKVLFSKGLLMLYLFGSIFFNFFHQHPYQEPDHQNSVKVSDISCSFTEKGLNDDCLACHFHQASKTLIPIVFEFGFPGVKTMHEVATAPVLKVAFAAFREISLRGPPMV